MSQTIISDTSCLILLSKIDELDLLHKVFGQVIITEVVAKEFNKDLPEWIKVKSPGSGFERTLEPFLDKGEASVIALALEEKTPLLIIDEAKGRKVAKSLGIKYTGTLGVIGSAKTNGKITSVEPIVDKIRKTNFRISEDLLQRLLKQ